MTPAKKFANIETYNFTLATEYSADGGHTWHDSAPLATPGFTVMTDPTLAWDDSGNVFLVGLGGTLGPTPPVFQTTGIVMYKSADGGATWSAPYPIAGTAGADKQWAADDSSPSSPYHGNVYAVWDKLDAPGGMAFARTRTTASPGSAPEARPPGRSSAPEPSIRRSTSRPTGSSTSSRSAVTRSRCWSRPTGATRSSHPAPRRRPASRHPERAACH